MNEEMVEKYSEKSNFSPKILETFYRFCINYWSYQLFLELQTDSLISLEKKPLSFSCEIINTIELFNLKSSDKKNDYRFIDDNSNAVILADEIRLKLFLHVIVDFAKNFAESNSLIKFSLQSFDTVNIICYTFTCCFTSYDLNSDILLSIFKKKRKNLEDIESFAAKFDLAYALFSSNLKGLAVNVKNISYSKEIATISFFIKFPITSLPNASIPLNVCTNRITQKSRILWHNQEDFFKSYSNKLVIETQLPISICKFDRKINYNIKVNTPSSSSDSISSESDPHKKSPQTFPKTLDEFPQISSCSGLSEFFNISRPRKAATSIKLRKSKKNVFQTPEYSKTNTRPVKKFFYAECLKTLNYEVGVFKVLIVDDFEENRKVLQELLNRIMKISCEFAKDGIGALEMYENYASQGYMYQIIFMDLIMPRLNGYQASLRIRQKEKDNNYPRTFICAVSGNKDCSAKCSESEIDDIGKI